MGIDIQAATDALGQWIAGKPIDLPEVRGFGDVGGTDNQKGASAAILYARDGTVPDRWLGRLERHTHATELGSDYDNVHILVDAALFNRAKQLGHDAVATAALKQISAWYNYTKSWEHLGEYRSPCCRGKSDRPYCATALMTYLDSPGRRLPAGVGDLRIRHRFFAGARAWARIGIVPEDLLQTQPRVYWSQARLAWPGGHVGFVTDGLRKCWDGPRPMVVAEEGRESAWIGPPMWLDDDAAENRQHFLQISGDNAVRTQIVGRQVIQNVRYRYRGKQVFSEEHRATIIETPVVTLYPRGQAPRTGGLELLGDLARPADDRADGLRETEFVISHGAAVDAKLGEAPHRYAQYYLTPTHRHQGANARKVKDGPPTEDGRLWQRVELEIRVPYDPLRDLPPEVQARRIFMPAAHDSLVVKEAA